MKFGRIVLRVNPHRLTESDFRFDATLSTRRPWRHFSQKSAATWWVHTQRLSSVSVLPRAYAAASASCWLVVHCSLVLVCACADIIATFLAVAGRRVSSDASSCLRYAPQCLLYGTAGGALKATIDKLRRLLNAAAVSHVLSVTRGCSIGVGRSSRMSIVDLHWLDVPERVR